jgi:hypothetical protein
MAILFFAYYCVIKTTLITVQFTVHFAKNCGTSSIVHKFQQLLIGIKSTTQNAN